MAEKEMWDYLASAITSADSTTILDISPQGAYVETGSKNVVIHTGDDNSEERIIFSSSGVFFLNVPWRALSASDGGLVVDAYHSTTIGNGNSRSFHYAHDDGHKYVVRFDGDLPRSRGLHGYHGFGTVKFKVLGKSTL